MKIIVLLGPTGIGKTTLSIHLAKKMNAVILNADATQIFKEPNIGTAKITEEEMEGIPHYLLNIASIKDEYNVKKYQEDGRKILEEFIKKNTNVIIVGGSGLYIKALLYDYKFNMEEEKKDYSNLTNKELKEKVDKIYKHNNIHENNRVRLERFLSHYEQTKEIIKTTENKDKPLYDFELIGLTAKRDILYKKLDERVDKMMENNFLEEAIELSKLNAPKLNTIIGYKELISYYNNEISKEEAIELIKFRTHKYAKRQYTWLNRQFKNIKWFETDFDNFNNTIKKVEAYLASK